MTSGDVSITAQAQPCHQGAERLASTVHLANGDVFPASFYLRLSRSMPLSWEGLGERLNDPVTRFLACKVDHQVQLLQLHWITYIETDWTSEAECRAHLEATRQPARISLRSGETLEGTFLSARLPDLPGAPGERFVLFLSQGTTCWVSRDAIVRVHLWPGSKC